MAEPRQRRGALWLFAPTVVLLAVSAVLPFVPPPTFGLPASWAGALYACPSVPTLRCPFPYVLPIAVMTLVGVGALPLEAAGYRRRTGTNLPAILLSAP